MSRREEDDDDESEDDEVDDVAHVVVVEEEMLVRGVTTEGVGDVKQVPLLVDSGPRTEEDAEGVDGIGSAAWGGKDVSGGGVRDMRAWWPSSSCRSMVVGDKSVWYEANGQCQRHPLHRLPDWFVVTHPGPDK